MRPTLWTDDHHRLLADHAPDASGAVPGEVERVWNRVEASIGGAEPRRRSRRVRIAVGVAVGAAVLGTSAVASAQFNSAHTGRGPIDAEDLSLGGPGERLDPVASDFGQVITEQTTDIPFPDASSRQLAIADQVGDFRGRGTAPGAERVSVGAIRAWVADAAVCAWSNQWAAATKADDAPERGEAIEALAAAPNWPAVVAIDPKPYSHTITQQVTGMDGVTRTEDVPDISQFYYLGPLGRAAQGQDLDAVADLLAQGNGYCRPNLVPDLPRAYAPANPTLRGN